MHPHQKGLSSCRLCCSQRMRWRSSCHPCCSRCGTWAQATIHACPMSENALSKVHEWMLRLGNITLVSLHVCWDGWFLCKAHVRAGSCAARATARAASRTAAAGYDLRFLRTRCHVLVKCLSTVSHSFLTWRKLAGTLPNSQMHVCVCDNNM